MKKVLLGLSGGLDSTYSVSELRKAGYDVLGATLVMHEYTDLPSARKCAELLGVPLFEVDCREAFDKAVKSYFAGEYMLGRTPNPCVICNRQVKFEYLLQTADKLGCEFIATGHYAGVACENGRYYVTRGADAKKDQSYMLWNLTQRQLSRVIFPLEKLMKSDVKQTLRENGLDVSGGKESEDICFLPSSTPLEFVESVTGALPAGDFIDKNGNFIAKHKGIANYTVGQRRGLGVSAKTRLFVTDIDPAKNTVTLGEEGDLFSDTMRVARLNFQRRELTEGDEAELYVKIRYAAPPVRSIVKISGGAATVRLCAPAKAIAKGQSAVFYDDDGIVFGGIIN